MNQEEFDKLLVKKIPKHYLRCLFNDTLFSNVLHNNYQLLDGVKQNKTLSLGATSFSNKPFECSAKRAAIVSTFESNVHAQSDICSLVMLLTNSLRVLCSYLS